MSGFLGVSYHVACLLCHISKTNVHFFRKFTNFYRNILCCHFVKRFWNIALSFFVFDQLVLESPKGMWYHVRFSCTLVFTNHQFRFKTMQFGRKSNILYEVLVKAAHVFSGALWQRHCQLKSSISKEFYSRVNQLENNNNLDLTLKFLGSYRIQVEREVFVG